MKTDTRNKILNYIAEQKEVTIHQITEYLGLSPQAIHRQVKQLLNAEEIQRVGTPPKVFYSINEFKRYYGTPLDIDQSYAHVISQRFLYITPYGKQLYGIDGFIEWCSKRDLDLMNTAKDYSETVNKYDQYKKDTVIDGMPKLTRTFANIYLDKLFYTDFYSIERFGKTKLGSLILYAKQSEDLGLIKEIVAIVKPQIQELIARENIDAVGFVPPTLPRQVQFMHKLNELLNLNLPAVNIVKVKNEIRVAQKTLNKLEDRIINASKTIFIDDQRTFHNLLLIDDAVGSGATLNETARKIRDKKLVTNKIVGLALTGSFNGFEVISEA